MKNLFGCLEEVQDVSLVLKVSFCFTSDSCDLCYVTIDNTVAVSTFVVMNRFMN